MLNEFKHFIAVAPLIVVPAYELDKRVGERDSGFGVENRSPCVADKVRRNDVLVGVAEYAREFVFLAFISI